jgi:DNA topoisomerase-2
LEQITKGIVNYIKEKKKVVVKPSYIRDNITLFVDCIIEDPSFSSQTKEYLTNKISTFGSRYELGEQLIKDLAETGLVDEVVKFAQFKEMTGLNKTDGKKTNSLRGIEKLDDALWAGTRKSKYCKLILTEGDSAKAFALSGLGVIGREKFGVFPLRGKLLNVREATASQLLNNKEFINLKKILGLKQNKKYNDVSELRYGGIICLTDSDVDGSHIKGLIMNLFHTFWPSLLKHKGFIQAMNTPIIKAFRKSDTKKEKPIVFYTITEYKRWIETLDDPKKYTIKYYKGLGTSTDKEAKEVFNDFDNRMIKYIWESSNSDEEIKEIEEEKDEPSEGDPEDEKEEKEKDDEDFEKDEENLSDLQSKSYDALTLAFEKARANDRKKWLFKYNKQDILDFNNKEIGYSDFINKELIHFSNYDNERSIPSICDGFKPSQRKIMYACFKRNIEHDEIKVAQLGAYVAEHTEYHHGETSLQGAIINMAQDYVGSNNINLLLPIGNFGFRRLLGADQASARYIFTKLNPLTPYLFRKEDEPIYNYIIEENHQIEPESYAPILPMVLVNGCQGIGTGFSTTIPMFNPIEVANVILDMLDEKQARNLSPWFNGFNGTVKKLSTDKYQTNGKYEIVDTNKLVITEIPIGVSIDSYRKILESYLMTDKKPTDNEFLTDVIDKGDNNKVHFEVIFYGNKLQTLVKNNNIEKKFKLTSSIALTNMYLHNPKGVITKYEYVEDIFDDFYSYRLDIYKKRKEFMVRYLENQMNLLKYKVKFIEQKLDGEIIIERRKEQEILSDLDKKGYPRLSNDVNAEDEKKTYRYITDMPLFSLTKEKIDKLMEEYKAKKDEYDTYKSITPQDLWRREINEFIKQYDKIMAEKKEEVDKKERKESREVKKKITKKVK